MSAGDTRYHINSHVNIRRRHAWLLGAGGEVDGLRGHGGTGARGPGGDGGGSLLKYMTTPVDLFYLV